MGVLVAEELWMRELCSRVEYHAVIFSNVLCVTAACLRAWHLGLLGCLRHLHAGCQCEALSSVSDKTC